MTSRNGEGDREAVKRAALSVPVRVGVPGAAAVLPEVVRLLCREISAQISEFARVLNLEISPAVTLTDSRAEGLVTVSVHGRQCGYPAVLPIMLETYLAGFGAFGVAHGALRRWLSEAGGPDSPAASLAAEYLGLLTAGAIEIQPSVLLSEGRLSASGADELAPPRYEDVIRGLLDLGLPAGEPEQVATAVHGKPDVAAAVEQLAADQSQQEWVVLVEPGYLRDLTLSHTAEQAAAAGVALNITGYDLGLPLPTFRVEADPLLRGGCFRFLINRTTTPPVRGVPVDHLLVTGATSGQLAGGTETRECVFGAQSVLVPAVQRSVADELGLTAWDASTYLGLCLYWAVRRRARRLVDNVRVAAGLDHLGQQRPVQAGLARRQIPLPVLTRVLRELTEEYVPIRNLAAIVDLLLEYEACAVPERPSRLAWTRAGMQETIAAEFASGFRSITIQELPLDAQRLAVNWMSSGGTDDLTRERFLAALRTVVSVVPGAPMLVAGEARRAVYLAARAEFPDLRVLTAAELPPDFEVSQTDAGSMPSLS